MYTPTQYTQNIATKKTCKNQQNILKQPNVHLNGQK